MKTLSFAFFTACLLGSFAFGGTPSQNLAPSATVVSFDDIRAACLNPSRFHNQIAPTNIQISCKDVQSKWVPAADGSLKMGCGRQVTTSVISDKYTTHAVTGMVPMALQVASCPRFKEVTEAVEAIKAVSCDELVAFTGNAIEFCAGAINALRSSNPSALSIKDTGRAVDLCGSSASAGQRAQAGQRGQTGLTERQQREQHEREMED